MTNDEQIKELAYTLWEQEGRPDGMHVEHYFRAKRILEEQEAAHVIELAPPPPTVELGPTTNETQNVSSPQKGVDMLAETHPGAMPNNFSSLPSHRDMSPVKSRVASCVCPYCGNKQNLEFFTFPLVLEVLRGARCVVCRKRFYASVFSGAREESSCR